MASKKKKTDEKFNTYSLILLLILVAIGTVAFELKNYADYNVEARDNEIAMSKQKDTGEKTTVGWLRVQGTNIDLPVLYAPLYNFVYETGDFAWTEADFDELNNIVYITGHNIKNMSKRPLKVDESHNRFEQLMSFVYFDFAENNQFIQYSFKGQDLLYRIYSVSFIDESDLDMYNQIEYNKNDMLDFIKTTTENSIYKYDVDVDENDKLLSLNTCTNMFGEDQDIRITVNARLVRDDEKVKLASVEKAEKYNVIENIMEGGDSDEETDEV